MDMRRVAVGSWGEYLCVYLPINSNLSSLCVYLSINLCVSLYQYTCVCISLSINLWWLWGGWSRRSLESFQTWSGLTGYVYIYIYIHMYMCVYMCVYIYIYIYILTYKQLGVVAEVPQFPLINQLSWESVSKMSQHMSKCGNMWQQHMAKCGFIAKCKEFTALVRKPRLSRPRLEAGESGAARAGARSTRPSVSHRVV